MTFVLCLWGACSSRVDTFPLKGWLLERGSMHLSHGITEMSNIQIIEYSCAPIKLYQQKQERAVFVLWAQFYRVVSGALFDRLFAGCQAL